MKLFIHRLSNKITTITNTYTPREMSSEGKLTLVSYSPDFIRIRSENRIICRNRDGTRFVTESFKDDKLRIWDAVTVKPVGKALVGHFDSVTKVSYSRDGTRIVSGS